MWCREDKASGIEVDSRCDLNAKAYWADALVSAPANDHPREQSPEGATGYALKIPVGLITSPRGVRSTTRMVSIEKLHSGRELAIYGDLGKDDMPPGSCWRIKAAARWEWPEDSDGAPGALLRWITGRIHASWIGFYEDRRYLASRAVFITPGYHLV